ncbi:hypothetical protein HY212_02530 [Candidatus Pacearchaeota archaeon]|nr:hypothetical protein [Candidatus Pacearchaeota archaeon]
MKNKINKWIYWLPRILSILFILFISIFAFDVFDEFYGLELVIVLVMHLIPSFILMILLIISWKHEIVGGVAFIIAGIAHMVSSVVRAGVEPWYIFAAFSLIIDVPAFAIGILWILNWKNKKKLKKKNRK